MTPDQLRELAALWDTNPAPSETMALDKYYPALMCSMMSGYLREMADKAEAVDEHGMTEDGWQQLHEHLHRLNPETDIRLVEDFPAQDPALLVRVLSQADPLLRSDPERARKLAAAIISAGFRPQ